MPTDSESPTPNTLTALLRDKEVAKAPMGAGRGGSGMALTHICTAFHGLQSTFTSISWSSQHPSEVAIIIIPVS